MMCLRETDLFPAFDNTHSDKKRIDYTLCMQVPHGCLYRNV